MTKEEFNKFWEKSTKESILNQYYYDYITMRKLYEVIDKIKEYIKELKNFKIKYVMLEEKELFASEKDFVKDILELLEEIE